MIETTSVVYYKLNYTNMKITNKYTGRDVTKYYIPLLEGLITNDEFELLTLTIK